MVHQLWTMFSIGDPGTEESHPGSEITKSTRLPWPARSIEGRESADASEVAHSSIFSTDSSCPVAREYGLVIGKVSCEQFMKSAGSTYVKRSGIFFFGAPEGPEVAPARCTDLEVSPRLIFGFSGDEV
jgi:hypothetical protein